MIRNGSTVTTVARGLANVEHAVPITASTRFHVASLSKQFTALAALLLVRDGKLYLDDSVRRYLPWAPEGARVRHLIHHTSGIRDVWQLLILAGWRIYADPVTSRDAVRMLAAQTSTDFRPGEDYAYSNGGYVVLGEVVKAVSGKSLAALLRERVFGPFQMEATVIREDYRDVIPGLATGYRADRGEPLRIAMPQLGVTGATNLITTVEDLARWAARLDRPSGEVDAALVARLAEPGRLGSGRELPYAAGLTRRTWRGLRTLEHAGSDAGYRAHFLRLPEQQFTSVCLCNFAADAGLIARQLAEVFLASQLAPEPAVPASSPVLDEELKRREGVFTDETSRRIRRLVFTGGKLRVDVDTVLYALQPLDGVRFRNPNQGTTLTLRGDQLLEENSAGIGTVYTRVSPAAPDPAKFTGTYHSDELSVSYRLRLADRVLRLTGPKDLAEELEPVLATGFNSGLGHLWFEFDGQGRPSGFVLSGERVRGLRFRRIPGE